MARITWLADVLRDAGLTVVEHAGWKTHYRPGTWEPRYGIVHATAAARTSSDQTQVSIVRDGRSDLQGPIANACLDRQGRWHVLSAGRCNTTLAGTAGPYEGLGNTYALGIEACNDNRSEPWPDVQYRAYYRGWAAICRRLGWTPSHLRGHKEHTPGRKTDPTFDMGQFRTDVARVLAGEDDDVPTNASDIKLSGGSNLDAAIQTILARTNADVNEERFLARQERAALMAVVQQVLAEVSADPGVPLTVDDASAELIAGKIVGRVAGPVADEIAGRLQS